MSPQQFVAAYHNARETVSKPEQVVMLYEGMLKFLKQAQSAIAEGKQDKRFEAIKRVQDIVIALQNALDFHEGGEIAHILNDFYKEMRYQLSDIQKKPTTEAVEDVISQVRAMLESWREAISGNAGEAAQAHSSVPGGLEDTPSQAPHASQNTNTDKMTKQDSLQISA